MVFYNLKWRKDFLCILHNYYIIFSTFWEDSPIIQIVFIFYSHFIAILTLQSSKRKDADKICFFIIAQALNRCLGTPHFMDNCILFASKKVLPIQFP